MPKSYEESGVSLEAGYEVVSRIKGLVASTRRPGVMGGIGSFGGLFDPKAAGYDDPILVSGTDGVGTKLKLAFDLNRHNTIGIDAVAMCVNDVLAQGAQPLFFLDYVALGKNIPAMVEEIVSGVAEGCRQAECALIGGETAEMPGMYTPGEYDIAGFCVGAVERRNLIDGTKTKVGDTLIGLPSSGVHSNGFSLVRKIIKDANLDLNKHYAPLPDNVTLGDALIEPTRIYVRPVIKLINSIDVHGVAHITGGGFDENIPRMLPQNAGADIILGSWQPKPVFEILQKAGNIPPRDMYNVFNMGIGMVIAVDEKDADEAIKILKENNQPAMVIGKITEGAGIRLINE